MKNLIIKYFLGKPKTKNKSNYNHKCIEISNVIYLI